MADVAPGVTLTPSFRDFLPAWLARQPWYAGPSTPSLRPVGFIRFEDPAGEVGIETHLVTDGAAIYQVPMTYRGEPMPSGIAGAAEALIAIAEHSRLGTRWIYDAVADPVWADELLRLVATNGVCGSENNQHVGPAQARGHRLTARELTMATTTIQLTRVLSVGRPADEAGVLGLVLGTWCPDWPDATTASGCLAVVREATDQDRWETPLKPGS